MNPDRENDAWDPDYLRRRLQAMDDYDFEHLVGDLWEIQGWEIEVEQQSADAGVDVRATQTSPYPRKVLIQAKRYSDDNPVNGPDVQQYAALKQQESDTDESIIVTTGRFTGSAEDRADDLNVKLIDGEGLVELIDGLGAYEIVEEYIGQPQESRTQSQTDDRGHRKTRATSDDAFHYLTPEERTEIERVVGQNLDEYVREEQYRAARAMERARAVVELNPHDAKELGVFEDAPLYDFEREFTEKKTQLVFLKDDIHVDEDGEVYVEDLTDYIKPSAIRGRASNGVIGVIKRGVKDGAWLSESGKNYWETQKQLRRFKKKGKGILSSLLDDDESSDSTDVHSDRTSVTGTAESADRVSDEVPQNPSGPGRTGGTNSTSESKQAPSQPGSLDSAQSSNEISGDSKISDSDLPDGVNTEEPPQHGNSAAPVQQTRDPESETGREPTIQTDSTDYDLSRTNWFYGVAIATGAWALTWLLMAVLPNAAAPLAGLLILVAWPLLPIAMIMDTRKIGKFEAETGKSLIYIFGSLLPILAVIPGAAYLYRRENSWGEEPI